MKSDNAMKIMNALSAIGLDWSLCFIGEDQPKKLGRLSAELRKPKNSNGDGKRVPSGFAYWGIVPTVAWRDTCQDEFYTLMRESIKNFPILWGSIKQSLDTSALHYASLGPGTGEKDNVIVRTICDANDEAFFFPIDMSPEMLRLGSKRAVEGTKVSRGNVLPVQIDFSSRANVEEIAKLLKLIVTDEPVLYSLLGNTLSNFEDDEELLSNVAILLRPQDKLLLEIATTDRLTKEASMAAADEYDQSTSFKYFVSSSLVQNTNLPVDIKNVQFLPSVEVGRSLLVKTVYRNNSPSFKMRVGNRESVLFDKGDTVRLSTMRKYSGDGIKSLLIGAGLRVIQQEWTTHPHDDKKTANFGATLLLLQSGEMPREKEQTWEFFIAHAGADLSEAERLYEALSANGVRVFLDQRSLKLGDTWDSVLGKAQAGSRVSLVLISKNTTSAYYQREEIAAAIALARRDEMKHRVVPIYIGKAGSSDEFEVPYGLRLKHSADLRRSDLQSVVRQLLDCL